MFYNFSCRPCDKTSPGSCFGSLKYASQQVYTNWATVAYGFLCIIDLFAVIIVFSVKNNLQRRGRESESRRKPIVKDAKNAFRQLLSEQKDITTSSTFKRSQSADSKDSWHHKLELSLKYPSNKRGKKRRKILSDDDRESVFSDYIDRLMNEMESKKDGKEGPKIRKTMVVRLTRYPVKALAAPSKDNISFMRVVRRRAAAFYGIG